MNVGLTWRVAGFAAAIWIVPSFHVIVHGAVPVRATFIVETVPAQTVPPPVTVAVGRGLTVTRADPEAVPAQPFAPDTAVIVYVVVTAGETTRVAGVAAIPLWMNPSDHVRLHGPVPVKATESVVLSPAQSVAPPVKVAPAAVAVVLRVNEPVAGAAIPSVTCRFTGPVAAASQAAMMSAVTL